MTPDIYNWLAADTNVETLLGNDDGIAAYRDEATKRVAAPYLVWSIVAGTPFNKLSEAPRIDDVRVQFDAYAPSAEGADAADAIYVACRDVLEQHGYVVSFNGSMRDPETRNYRVSWDMSFKVHR